MMIYIKTNELYHYGMPRKSGRYKWGSGERPYQGDKIGEIKRRKKSVSEMTNEELQNYNTRKGLENRYKKLQDPSILETIQDISSKSMNVLNETSKQIDKAYNDYHRQEKSRIDLSAVDDATLRKIVNRMQLEQSYRNLSPAYVSKGETILKQTFSVLGSVTAIAASSLGIALSVKKLMGG